MGIICLGHKQLESPMRMISAFPYVIAALYLLRGLPAFFATHLRDGTSMVPRFGGSAYLS
jgi:hypothetical protein